MNNNKKSFNLQSNKKPKIIADLETKFKEEEAVNKAKIIEAKGDKANENKKSLEQEYDSIENKVIF